MPEVYVGSNVLVLPSEYEPFGLVVNEAMLCGRPAVVSDQVGARFDLVREGETGFVYPCGDVARLAAHLERLAREPQLAVRLGEAARERMRTWSPRENVEALVGAVERAIALRGRPARIRR